MILTTRWIPVVTHYQRLEEFPYSYSYTVTENRETPHRESVFSSESVKLNLTQTDYYWISKDFHLEKGWYIEVWLNWTFSPTTDYRDIVVYVTDGSTMDYWGNHYYYASSETGSFMAPHSGNFHVIIADFGLHSVQLHSAFVTLTAEWTEVQSEQRVENVTETTTFDVTMYNVTYVSPIDLMLRRT